jgi:hypothetical protein
MERGVEVNSFYIRFANGAHQPQDKTKDPALANDTLVDAVRQDIKYLFWIDIQLSAWSPNQNLPH